MRTRIESHLTASHGRIRFVSSIWDIPLQDAADFKKSVREILDGIGRQRKPRRPVHKNDTPATEAGREEEDTDDDDQSTLTSGASI